MIAKETIEKIFTTDTSGELLVTTAKILAEDLKRQDATKTQIRNIFTELRIVETKWDSGQADGNQVAIRRLNLLRPKIAYQVKRLEKEFHGKVEKSPLKPLEDFLLPAIDYVNRSNNQINTFKILMNFMEATLAYHKAIGGSDK